MRSLVERFGRKQAVEMAVRGSAANEELKMQRLAVVPFPMTVQSLRKKMQQITRHTGQGGRNVLVMPTDKGLAFFIQVEEGEV